MKIYYCGTRISECTALTWDDVDFENNTININKQILSVTNKGWKYSSTKRESNRVVKFGQTLRNILIKEKDRQEQSEKEYGEFYYKIYMRNGYLIASNEELPYERIYPMNLGNDGRMTTFRTFYMQLE